MANQTFIHSLTADEHREAAKALYRRSAESFERCDTDGFLSQWAADSSAARHRTAAEVLDNGGRYCLMGLYDGERRVAAVCRSFETRFGHKTSWILTDEEEARYGRKFIPFGGRSRIQKQLGLTERWEMALVDVTHDGVRRIDDDDHGTTAILCDEAELPEHMREWETDRRS